MKQVLKFGLLVPLLLIFNFSAYGGSIFIPIQTGPTGWTVSGGSCPSGASTCSQGNTFSNSAAVVAFDAALVEPIPGLGNWATAPLDGSDQSAWIVPATRADGTVKYNSPNLGGDMDFGLYTYEFSTTFSLSAPDVSTANITGFWWVDGQLQAGCGVKLNGACFSLAVPSLAYGIAGGSAFSLFSGFIAGTNILTFVVDNSYRETGLRANMLLDPQAFGITAIAVPEPATLPLSALGVLGLALAAFRRRAGFRF